MINFAVCSILLFKGCDGAMKEFFGFGGYVRQPEGAFSWQHLLFVGSLLAAMVVLAIVLAVHNRNKLKSEQNRVLIWAALLINAVEILKIIVFCLRSNSIDGLLYNLPLFLCSIQLIALPLAAFSKGRIKEASMDFVCIFGVLGAVFGIIGAIQNYNAYPVLGIENVASGITHSISGFASLYILISKMASMKKRNSWITFVILMTFCAVAYITNILIDYNYMFLMSHDGTPYSVVYNLVGGNAILYPVSVALLFLLYIWAFYAAFYLITAKAKTKRQPSTQADALSNSEKSVKATVRK